MQFPNERTYVSGIIALLQKLPRTYERQTIRIFFSYKDVNFSKKIEINSECLNIKPPAIYNMLERLKELMIERH